MGDEAFRQPDAHGFGIAEPKGWHSRGYLPHLDAAYVTQFVTFRLADAVPLGLVQRWQRELRSREESDDDRAVTLRRKIERYADRGYGACHLRRPDAAGIVRDALLHFDRERYRLTAWCIMPNHVHVLLQLLDDRHSLPEIVHSWKSWTASRINKQLGLSGPLWMSDYFDRYIREPAHLDACVRYIHQNPVKAGLANTAAEWPWSG